MFQIIIITVNQDDYRQQRKIKNFHGKHKLKQSRTSIAEDIKGVLGREIYRNVRDQKNKSYWKKKQVRIRKESNILT